METPRIKYDPEKWEYIKTNLEELGYRLLRLSEWKFCPYIVLDFVGNVGKYSNLSERESSNRYEVTNVEEFLEISAILIGKQYKRKDMVKIHDIEIKPGMVITTTNNSFWIAFPTEKGLAVINYGAYTWDLIDNFINHYKEKIISIRDLSKGKSLSEGNILWKKSEEVVLTMQEIADKFNIPLKNLRIKE
jgi:hypothetical protein|nr:MAG TPA: hypothetical protein [Crassvirales sp.]